MGDIRLDRLSRHISERAVETGSLVLKKLGAKRAGEVAVGRFPADPAVDPAMILAPAIERTRAARGRPHRGRRARHTTEINFAKARMRVFDTSPAAPVARASAPPATG